MAKGNVMGKVGAAIGSFAPSVVASTDKAVRKLLGGKVTAKMLALGGAPKAASTNLVALVRSYIEKLMKDPSNATYTDAIERANAVIRARIPDVAMQKTVYANIDGILLKVKNEVLKQHGAAETAAAATTKGDAAIAAIAPATVAATPAAAAAPAAGAAGAVAARDAFDATYRKLGSVAETADNYVGEVAAHFGDDGIQALRKSDPQAMAFVRDMKGTPTASALKALTVRAKAMLKAGGAPPSAAVAVGAAAAPAAAAIAPEVAAAAAGPAVPATAEARLAASLGVGAPAAGAPAPAAEAITPEVLAAAGPSRDVRLAAVAGKMGKTRATIDSASAARLEKTLAGAATKPAGAAGVAGTVAGTTGIAGIAGPAKAAKGGLLPKGALPAAGAVLAVWLISRLISELAIGPKREESEMQRQFMGAPPAELMAAQQGLPGEQAQTALFQQMLMQQMMGGGGGGRRLTANEVAI